LHTAKFFRSGEQARKVAAFPDYAVGRLSCLFFPKQTVILFLTPVCLRPVSLIFLHVNRYVRPTRFKVFWPPLVPGVLRLVGESWAGSDSIYPFFAGCAHV
jgi:hypothetical protein